jgi:hypothetical protein
MFLLRALGIASRATAIPKLKGLYPSQTHLSTMAIKRDPNTLSNYHEIRTTQVYIDFDINFEKKRLEGSVTLKLKGVADAAVKEVILDTRLVALCPTKEL